MDRVFVYDVDAIPDCNDHRLLTLCGGEVRGRIFGGFEHLLRMLANFKDSQVVVSLRFIFDPSSGGLLNRLGLQLAVKVAEGVSEDIARQLIDAGPLCEFYEFKNCRSVKELELPDFPFACEILRREQRVETQLPRELNRYIPSSGFYYSPSIFLPREDNDYLTLDTLLSRMSQACLIELTAAAVNHTADRQAHEKYLRQLMAINDYGEDLYSNIRQDYQSSGFFGDEDKTVLEEVKKKDPIADEILREQQEYHSRLRQPQLFFNIKAYARSPESALMLASTLAEASFGEGSYRQVAYGIDDGPEAKKRIVNSLKDSRNMDLSFHVHCDEIWGKDLPEAWKSLGRLSRLATVDELKGAFRFPVGGYSSPRCIRKSTDPIDGQFDSKTSILIGDDLESELPPARKTPSKLSLLFNDKQPTTLELRLSTKSLNKHLFIAGVPGSGKTTAVHNMLIQLYLQGIPFLVIEPAKSEYRSLKTLSNHPDPGIQKMARDIRVYTAGNDTLSPLRFNPLAYCESVTLDEHIGQVLACFEAAMPMGGPLQALIAEAVEEVYAGRRWGDFPQMEDLLHAAGRIMETKNYEGEIRSNLQAAIGVRLGLLTRRAMGRLFSSPQCIPAIEDLLSYPTIIEMDYLSQDHACLLTLFLLAAVREQIRIDPKRRQNRLHHVTVIEEAHNIVGRTSQAKASEEIADPKAFAAQYVSRMLAELRALGEGIIIADQLPSTVAPEVVKNTGTKLAHRLVSSQDREELGGAMLMGKMEIEQIARLSPGEAYFYTEGLYRPRRVRCLNSNAYLGLEDKEIPIGAEVLRFLEKDEWFIGGNVKRAMMALIDLFERQSELSKGIEDANIELKQCIGRLTQTLELQDASQQRAELEDIKYLLLVAKDKLKHSVEIDYLRRTESVSVSIGKAAEDSHQVKKLLQQLEDQFNNLIVEDFRDTVSNFSQLQDKIDELLQESIGKGVIR